MIEVSEAWKDIQQRFLLPETFVEIDCTISEVGSEEGATVVGSAEAVFSDASSTIDDAPKSARYATNELNLWALDGSCSILPSAKPYKPSGYVSNIASTGSVTLSFPAVHTVASSGLTITWSDLYGEYPRVFTVTAKNGESVVAETTITDNTDKVSAVFLQLQNYDSITITVHDWCLPNRRTRIEKVVIGHVLTFTKKDIISFKHEQHGDPLSGELPKYSIEFTLDNSDGRWNPTNPTGMEQYLSERQKLVVRYGMDVNGAVEWIPGGVFYLSEWDAPANGLEARFVARDVFEFLFYEDKSAFYTTLYSMVTYDATYYLLPKNSQVVVDASLGNYTAEYLGDGTAAGIVQKSANAARCIIRYDRAGTLYIEKLGNVLSDYRVPLSLSYAHPEIKLAKPLKEVSVAYGNDSRSTYSVSSSGETQTVNNDFVSTQAQAQEVAEWVAGVLKNRKTVSGEFRADPRLDLFDIVTVESKYGPLAPVVITNITYTYNGSFRGSYTGRVLEV
jgi:hypothetical protein